MKQKPYEYDANDYQRLDEFVLFVKEMAGSVYEIMRSNAAELRGEDRKAHKVDEIESAHQRIRAGLEQFTMARNNTKVRFEEFGQPSQREMKAMGRHYDRVKESFAALKTFAVGIYAEAKEFEPAEIAINEAGARLTKMGISISKGISKP